MAAGQKAGTRVARQAFLYGEGNGRRVLDVKRLAEIGGLNEATVRRWLPGWEQELENDLRGSTENGIKLHLSAEILREHRKHELFFRNSLNETIQADKEAGELASVLRRAIREAAVHDKDAAEAVLSQVNAFCNMVASKKTLQTQAVMLKKAWNEASGMSGAMAVAETREKTLATGRAKLEIQREAGPPDPANVTPETPGKSRSIFRRGAPPVDLVAEVADEGDGLGEGD